MGKLHECNLAPLVAVQSLVFHKGELDYCNTDVTVTYFALIRKMLNNEMFVS